MPSQRGIFNLFFINTTRGSSRSVKNKAKTKGIKIVASVLSTKMKSTSEIKMRQYADIFCQVA